MPHKTGPILPSRVRLPAGQSTLSGQHLEAALGISRARLHLWRKNYNFPEAYRNCWTRQWVTLTKAAAEWLANRDVKIEWV